MSIKKRILATILAFAMLILNFQPVLANELEKVPEISGELNQNEILSLLGASDISLPTEEEYEYMQNNIDYILDSESESVMQEKITELGVEQWVEINDYIPNTSKPQSRVGIPGMFSADFVNRQIDANFFRVMLEFTNYTIFQCIQVAGYVKYYYYTSGIGKEISITAPYVNETAIKPNSTRIADSYSYQHNGLKARYEGSFVVVDESLKPKVMPIVKEHKN